MFELWRTSLENSSGFRALQGEDRRAVLAAIADTVTAQEAWEDLIADVDFVDIARSTQRLTPMVYLNLKGVSDLPDRARLRGAYKHAWSKNHKMIATLANLVSEFDLRGINYRIVKGMAIQLLLGIVGARVVGDIDLVVNRADVEGARRLLENFGFRCNSVSNCGAHAAGSEQNALDFNLGDVDIDLHVAELKQPSALLEQMLRERPNRVDYAGVAFCVPSPELLILHSAAHGHVAGSETDFSQSVADISLLIARCDRDVLLRSAAQTSLGEELWSVGQTLSDLGKNGVDFPRPKMSLRPKQEVVSITAKKALVLWHHRFRGGRPLLAALRAFKGKKFLYLLWTLLGQFSSLERLLFAREGGFLALPDQSLEAGALVRPFGKFHPRTVSPNLVAIECLDFRFSFRCPPGVRELVLSFGGDCLREVDVGVHHNGQRLLKFVRESNYRTLAVKDPPMHNEISFRPLTLFYCQDCFRALENLEVSVSYRFKP